MRFLVLGASPHSANLGVRVLAEGARHFLTDAFGPSTVEFQNFDEGDCPYPATRKALVLERLRSSDLGRWYRSFDLVFDTGGGDSFSDIYGLRRLSHLVLQRQAGRAGGVPVVLAPQTVGPFTTVAGRLLVRRSLSGVQLVLTRDAVSFEHVRRYTKQNTVATSDLVFALPRPRPSAESEGYDVLVNVSGLLWSENPHVDHEKYRSECERLVRHLMTNGTSVALLVHVLPGTEGDEDLSAARQLQDRLGLDVPIVVPTSLDDVREIISGTSLVVGARMHACLNALSLGVPAIPWAYSRKFAPLLADLGWTHVQSLQAAGDWAEETVRHLADLPLLTSRAADAADAGRIRLREALLPLRRAVAA